MNTEKAVGICPACGEAVFNSREVDGPVWTCRFDLSPTNPYWEPHDEAITEERQEAEGCYSYCLDEWTHEGGYCDNHMPLHSKCYDNGGY